MSKEYTDEIINKKAIEDYGGDLNKTINDFSSLAKNTKNVSALIYAHEISLHSMIKALPSFYRNAKMGVGNVRKVDVDDIDHLSNRRIRTVGEQLSNQFNIGLSRMARTIRERMNVRDNEVFAPVDLINSIDNRLEIRGRDSLGLSIQITLFFANDTPNPTK